MTIGKDWQQIQRMALKIEGPKTPKEIEMERYHLISDATTRIFQAGNAGVHRTAILERLLRDQDTARGSVLALYTHHHSERRDLRREDFVGPVQTLFDWCVKQEIFCFLVSISDESGRVALQLHGQHSAPTSVQPQAQLT